MLIGAAHAFLHQRLPEKWQWRGGLLVGFLDQPASLYWQQQMCVSNGGSEGCLTELQATGVGAKCLGSDERNLRPRVTVKGCGRQC
jgi:hypothetical protein